MNDSLRGFSHRHREGLLSAVSAGFFLILVGMLFVATPKLFDDATTFFSNFNVTQVPNTEIRLPAPIEPPSNSSVRAANLAVYTAVEQFSVGWGIFLAAMLAIRFVYHSPSRRKAENLGDTVFWFGTAYLTQKWLIDTTNWFPFWSTIIILIGLSLIVRAIFLAAARATSA